MRIHFLPAEQEKRNEKAIEKLRRIGYVLFVLLVAALALGAKLYFWPPMSHNEPGMAGDDGQGSVAIVITPDLVLTPAKFTGAAEFSTRTEHRKANRIGATTLPDGTDITLLRLETPTTAAPVAVVVIDAGDELVATASGQEWHGSAKAKTDAGYPVEPDFSLNAGTPVYRNSDRGSLVGFAVRTASGSVIVSAQDVLNHFPETRAGH